MAYLPNLVLMAAATQGGTKSSKGEFKVANWRINEEERYM